MWRLCNKGPEATSPLSKDCRPQHKSNKTRKNTDAYTTTILVIIKVMLVIWIQTHSAWSGGFVCQRRDWMTALEEVWASNSPVIVRTLCWCHKKSFQCQIRKKSSFSKQYFICSSAVNILKFTGKQTVHCWCCTALMEAAAGYLFHIFEIRIEIITAQSSRTKQGPREWSQHSTAIGSKGKEREKENHFAQDF